MVICNWILRDSINCMQPIQIQKNKRVIVAQNLKGLLVGDACLSSTCRCLSDPPHSAYIHSYKAWRKLNFRLMKFNDTYAIVPVTFQLCNFGALVFLYFLPFSKFCLVTFNFYIKFSVWSANKKGKLQWVSIDSICPKNNVLLIFVRYVPFILFLSVYYFQKWFTFRTNCSLIHFLP